MSGGGRPVTWSVAITLSTARSGSPVTSIMVVDTNGEAAEAVCLVVSIHRYRISK
jgi:hypothetical protein